MCINIIVKSEKETQIEILCYHFLFCNLKLWNLYLEKKRDVIEIKNNSGLECSIIWK